MPFDNPVLPFGRGLSLRIPGHTLIMPRLTLGQRKAVSEELKAITRRPDTGICREAREAAVLKIVRMALGRHYPNVTDDDIRDNFADEDVLEAWFYAMNIVRQPGDAKKRTGRERPGVEDWSSIYGLVATW